RLRDMGAEFSFGDFLVERGMLPQMAVTAFESESGESFGTVDTLGDFQLIELLGEGENGAVYRATQLSLDRDVAVKILNTEIAQDPAAVEHFLSEAYAVARINHPNVVQIYSRGTEHGLHYFAMELLEGGSARDLIADAEDGRLTERRALEITAQAAEGLKAAHANGILHRDVKPDNILLSKMGVAKITDLGIAQVVHATADGGTFWGSPPYVAPETVRGTSPNDPRSDIYSLGATLFELLTGEPPFSADDPAEVLRMHLDEAPRDVRDVRPDVSSRTATLVKLMLAKEPNERIRDADMVAKQIAKILSEPNSASHPVSAAAPAPKTIVKPPVLAPRRLPVGLGSTVKRALPTKPVPGRIVRPMQRPAAPIQTATKKPSVPVQPVTQNRPPSQARPSAPVRPSIPARPLGLNRIPGKRP
ncbi:MAG: protein kinase, partial [Planctomycetota bacterium]